MPNTFHVLINLSPTLQSGWLWVWSVRFLCNFNLLLHTRIFFVAQLCHFECLENNCVSIIIYNSQLVDFQKWFMQINSLRLRKWKINETSWYHMNHLYAWAIPIVLTTVLIVKHSITPTLGIGSCWFHREYIEYYIWDFFKRLFYLR